MYYIIFRRDFYRQEILGLFDDLEKAKKIAKTKYDDDDDDAYYTIVVAEIELNKEIEDVTPVCEFEFIKENTKFIPVDMLDWKS